MPRSPILYRESFYCPVRGTREPTTGEPLLKPLEWNNVTTELGQMVEPRQSLTSADASKVVNVDMTDMAICKISIIDEHAFQNAYGTGGSGMIDYNI